MRKALEADPDNGAYLDSLGWAYFTAGDLAEAESLSGPGGQPLPSNSEVQDHLGDVLAEDACGSRGRLEARARGRRQDIDRGEIQKKIDDARTNGAVKSTHAAAVMAAAHYPATGRRLLAATRRLTRLTRARRILQP